MVENLWEYIPEQAVTKTWFLVAHRMLPAATGAPTASKLLPPALSINASLFHQNQIPPPNLHYTDDIVFWGLRCNCLQTVATASLAPTTAGL